jgi:hypothetical protein
MMVFPRFGRVPAGGRAVQLGRGIIRQCPRNADYRIVGFWGSGSRQAYVDGQEAAERVRRW